MSSIYLESTIANHSAQVGVIGLGYVGFPLAIEAARVGFRVIGVDRDKQKCKNLNRGISPNSDISAAELQKLIRAGQFEATSGFKALEQCNVITLCLPTPLNPSKDPDLSYVKHATLKVAEVLHSKKNLPKLVILESTSYPGTTEEVVMPMLSKSGTIPDQDFFLAFSPERVDPGSDRWRISNTPKLVGGTSKVAGELAGTFYRQFVSEVLELASPRIAEMAKLLENIFRAVNIALVNELWMLCDRMGIDIWEVIEAASTKPFGYMPFWPGPGLGGHCIPVDPFYLSWKAREYGFHTEFIELAGKINVSMPYFVVGKVIEALNLEGKSLKDSRILILGVAYKKEVSDTRESPAFKVMELLQDKGAELIYHDPHVEHIVIRNDKLHSTQLTQKLLAGIDCVLVLTAHSKIDYEMVKKSNATIVDTRNVTNPHSILSRSND